MLNQIRPYLDTPFTWAALGFIIGLVLGVSQLSVWLVAIGFGLFLIYLRLHNQADESTEGWIFASGPVFMISWILGFIIHSLVL